MNSQESGFSLIIDPISDLKQELAGKSNSSKERYLMEVFGAKQISQIYESLGYWVVTHTGGTGIFSLADNTFLRLPHFGNNSEYFGGVNSILAVPMMNGERVLALGFGRMQGVGNNSGGIDTFCYIENGKVETMANLPVGSNLQMAIMMFQTQRNNEIARTMSEAQPEPSGASDSSKKHLH